MNRTELNLALADEFGDARGLRSAEGEVEALGDALFEHVEMHRQRHAGLHHVQIVDLLRIDLQQAIGQVVGLLLVVALDVDAIEGADHRLQQRDGVFLLHLFAGSNVLGRGLHALARICGQRVPLTFGFHEITPVCFLEIWSGPRPTGLPVAMSPE